MAAITATIYLFAISAPVSVATRYATAATASILAATTAPGALRCKDWCDFLSCCCYVEHLPGRIGTPGACLSPPWRGRGVPYRRHRLWDLRSKQNESHSALI